MIQPAMLHALLHTHKPSVCSRRVALGPVYLRSARINAAQNTHHTSWFTVTDTFHAPPAIVFAPRVYMHSCLRSCACHV